MPAKTHGIFHCLFLKKNYTSKCKAGTAFSLSTETDLSSAQELPCALL